MRNPCCEEAARRIAALEAELRNKQDRLLRALAQSENLRRRLQRVIQAVTEE